MLSLKDRATLPVYFKSGYKNWADCAAQSEGYDSQVIYEKVYKSSLKAKNREVLFERDSFLFNKPEYPILITNTLSYFSRKYGHFPSVIDYGGALGSLYFASRSFFQAKFCNSWNIVEQSYFVEKGKNEFTIEELSFSDNVDIFQQENIDILILSATLPYLENPFQIIESLMQKMPKLIIIDRTLFLESTATKFFVQVVKEPIYKASYPVRIGNGDEVISYFDRHNYKLITDLSYPHVWWTPNGKISSRGLVFEKIS